MFLRVLVSTPKHEQTIKDQIFWESLTQKKVKKKKNYTTEKNELYERQRKTF